MTNEQKPVAFFYDFATEQQLDEIPKGWKVSAKWQSKVEDRQKQWRKKTSANKGVPKPKYSVCDPTKLRRKRKSEAPEDNVKRSRTEEDINVIPTENCEADVAITKVDREEIIYTEEETRGF